jgi:hypothetical protein
MRMEDWKVPVQGYRSHDVTRFVRDCGRQAVKLSSDARHLLVMVADRTRAEQPWCYPSQEVLAEDTGLSSRTVRRKLVELEALGLITRHQRHTAGGKQLSDAIRIHLPNLEGGQAVRPRGDTLSTEDQHSEDQQVIRKTNKSEGGHAVPPARKKLRVVRSLPGGTSTSLMARRSLCPHCLDKRGSAEFDGYCGRICREVAAVFAARR